MANQRWPQAVDVGIEVTVNGRPAKIFAGSQIVPFGEPGAGGILIRPPSTAPNAMPIWFKANGSIEAVKELLQPRLDAEPDHSRITE